MKSILVVDDSATVRKFMNQVLHTLGHNIIEAKDGIDAIQLMAKHKIDLVIADLNMPRMNGIDLIQSIRENPDQLDLPIIMLTTEADDESRKKAISIGANVFLVKPASPQVIVYKVNSLLGVES